MRIRPLARSFLPKAFVLMAFRTMLLSWSAPLVSATRTSPCAPAAGRPSRCKRQLRYRWHLQTQPLHTRGHPRRLYLCRLSPPASQPPPPPPQRLPHRCRLLEGPTFSAAAPAGHWRLRAARGCGRGARVCCGSPPDTPAAAAP